MSCADALDGVIISWESGRQYDGNHQCIHPSDSDSGCGYDFVSLLSRASARSRVASYDIIGRLEVAANLPKPKFSEPTYRIEKPSKGGIKKGKTNKSKFIDSEDEDAAASATFGCHEAAVDCARRELERQRSVSCLPYHFYPSFINLEDIGSAENMNTARTSVAVPETSPSVEDVVIIDEAPDSTRTVAPANATTSHCSNETLPLEECREVIEVDRTDEVLSDFSSSGSI